MVPQLLVVVALLLCSGCNARQEYAARIPNGNNVPNPFCPSGETWAGVGHTRWGGTGARNDFGKDFAEAGLKWTTDLCHKDSDGDGLTNGEELGDPLCTWTEGSIPAETKKISHPGIHNDWDSSRASEAGFTWTCAIQGDCPGAEAPDARRAVFRFPPTQVPPQETNYWCKGFNFPDLDRDYHAIKFEANLNNSAVLHHMILYECERPLFMDKPDVCNDMTGCNQFVWGWAPGVSDRCLEDHVGIRFGRTSRAAKHLVLQIHWNNPQLVADHVDSSGVTLVYTPRLRKHDEGVIMVGPMDLTIPPNSTAHSEQGHCDGSCTKNLPYPLQLTGSVLHMHLAGRRIWTEQYRDGKLLRELGRNDNYDFNSQEWIPYSSPLTIMPGDQLKTTCVYNTVGRDKTTEWGEGTSDEMCLQFISYYPKTDFPSCVSGGQQTYCPARFPIKPTPNLVEGARSLTPVFPGRDTVCGDGSEYKFYARKGSVNKALVYFQDSGMCLDYSSCKETPLNVPDQAPSQGILDLNAPHNPFRDWTVVFVPSCTGDLHFGRQHRASEYGDISVIHNGFRNAKAALLWLFDEEAAPTSVHVTGCGDGGCSSAIWAAHVFDHYAKADQYQVTEGCAGIGMGGSLARGAMMWNAMAALPQWLVAGLTQAAMNGETSATTMFMMLAARYPNAKWAQVNYRNDKVQAARLGEDAATFPSRLAADLTKVAGQTPNFRYVVMNGVGHCVMSSSKLWNSGASGQNLAVWLRGFSSGAGTRSLDDDGTVFANLSPAAQEENLSDGSANSFKDSRWPRILGSAVAACVVVVVFVVAVWQGRKLWLRRSPAVRLEEEDEL